MSYLTEDYYNDCEEYLYKENRSIPKITNMCKIPDRIKLDYNTGRIIGYLYYGSTCYRVQLVHILDNNNCVIPDNYKMVAVNPSIY